MPEPFNLISVNFLICEKVLSEDGIVSLIRVVDVFEFVVPKDVPPEQRIIPMQAVAIIKIDGSFIGSTFDIELVRPNGEVIKAAGDFRTPTDPEEKYPGGPLTLQIIASIGVRPIQTGRHYLKLYRNGEPLATAAFTLFQKPDAQ